MRLRGLRAGTASPIVDQMARFGFEVWPRSRAGARGTRRSDSRGSSAAAAVRAASTSATFTEPGYAKMALNYRLEDGMLSTETRVLLTDERSRKAFRRYWLVIRPFSGLIRRAWLRAIARRASG